MSSKNSWIRLTTACSARCLYRQYYFKLFMWAWYHLRPLAKRRGLDTNLSKLFRVLSPIKSTKVWKKAIQMARYSSDLEFFLRYCTMFYDIIIIITRQANSFKRKSVVKNWWLVKKTSKLWSITRTNIWTLLWFKSNDNTFWNICPVFSLQTTN